MSDPSDPFIREGRTIFGNDNHNSSGDLEGIYKIISQPPPLKQKWFYNNKKCSVTAGLKTNVNTKANSSYMKKIHKRVKS